MRSGIAAWLLLASALYGAQAPPAKELVKQGLAQLKARNVSEAQKTFQAVLSLPDLSLGAWEKAEAHRGLGQVLNTQGRYSEARKELDEALKLHQSTGDRAALGHTYSSLGYNEWGFGRREKAREQYEKALIEYEAAGDLREKATTLYNMAFVPRTIEERLELLPRSLQAARDAGDRRLEGKILHLWSDTLYSAGQYRQAFSLLREALEILRQDASSKFELARVLTSMGRLYRTHNHDDHAIELYGQALQIQEELGDRQGVVQSLRSIALAQLESGAIFKAKEMYRRALAAAEATRSETVRSAVLVGLGQACEASGEHEEALAFLEQAYRIFGEKQNGSLDVLLANNYLALARPADAGKAAGEAIRLAPRYGEIETLLGGHYARARAREVLGDREGAVADLREALAVYEKMRSNLLPADFLKRGYSGKSAGLFQYGVDLFHRAGKAPEALSVAEQARARAFLDLLATRELQRRAASLPILGSQSGKPALDLQALSHKEADSAADDVPDLRSLASAPSVTSQEYQDAARQMKSTIVSYWASKQALYIWTVPPEGAIHVARVEVTRERLGELIARVSAGNEGNETRSGTAAARGLATRSGEQLAAAARSRAAWRDLYKLLIEPVRAYLPESQGSLVTVVPHGPIFRVPFAALLDGKRRYLVEDYSLNIVPSIALFRFSEKSRTPGLQDKRGYLLVSDPSGTPRGPSGKPLPPLPGARKEAAGILRVLGAERVKLLEGKAATESAVREALRDVRLVHLATHGILLDDQPFDSFLLLASGPKNAGGDGRLTAREIYDLRLNADLVVLSACSTALGQVTGDGIVGLTRAFFYAGAPSIMATLWDVADEPTQQLVSEFYRAYLGGASPSSALRTAQLQLLRRLRQGRVSVKTPLGDVRLPEDPMLWAGMALLGEP